MVGLLHAAHNALEGYRANCAGYPSALPAAFVTPAGSGACSNAAAYTSSTRDPLVEVVNGRVVNHYAWTYGPASCSSAGICASYKIEAVPVGVPNPDAWRTFTLRPHRLQWVSRGGIFNARHDGGYDW